MGETFGPYRVCEPLGFGGMATVHRAELEIDGHTHVVALKRLMPDLASDVQMVRRFVDEARLGQRLQHANIARTHEVGCIENQHFITLEYVRGPTLLRLFDHALETRAMPLHVTLHVATQVARALAYVHGLHDDVGRSLGLIHRDIAPSNIIVGESGAVKLIDFGVAKSSAAHVRTAVGSVIGKLGYVAPEYLRTGKLDSRADLYSLGVVIYEALTARRLFDVADLRSAERLRFARIAAPSSSNPHVPPELDAIILAALTPDPDARWQSAFDLYTALESVTHACGLAVSDRDVSAWISSEVENMPESPSSRTLEIAIDVEADVDDAFSRISRARSHGDDA